MHASTIKEVSEFQVSSLSKALEDLSEEVTSFALMNNATFPFVTMPHFEVNAYHARKQSGLEIIHMNPLVSALHRSDWEAYSVQHQGWMETARQIESVREHPQQAINHDNSHYPGGAGGIPGSIAPFISAVDMERGIFGPADFSRPVRMNLQCATSQTNFGRLASNCVF